MTTNNLIGYDPLAWMEGEEIEEIPAPEPAKKVTKSKAKSKVAPAEVEAEPMVMEEAVAAEIVEDEVVADEVEEIEVDVTIDEDGSIEVTVEADEHSELAVEVSVETDGIAENDVLDAIVEEVTEMPMEESNDESVEELPVEALPDAPVEPLVELESEATIKNIAKLYDTLKHVLDAHDTIEINAADVSAIDTATLQLLVSLKKDAPNLGKTVDIIYPSSRFVESAKLLGLLDVLEVAEA